MLNKQMTHIAVGEDEYPIICTFNVLEYIQEKYGTIQEFQKLVSGIVETGKKNGEGEDIYQYTPINVSALLNGLTQMINEGIEIENEQIGAHDDPLIKVDRNHVGKMFRMADISLSNAAGLVLDEIAGCIAPKNVQTAQVLEISKKREQQSTLRGFFLWVKQFFTTRKKK